jgi:hypothetical protein
VIARRLPQWSQHPTHRAELVGLGLYALHAKEQVRSVAAPDDHFRIPHPELLDDVSAYPGRRRRGQCQHRRVPQRANGRSEREVGWPKAVPPFGETVSLVNGQQGDR